MTRINLVPPSELMDQHLFAEFREIKMVPKALARSLKNHSVQTVLKKIPKNFTLNTGHVLYFYNKGEYLAKRYESLKQELDKRGYNYDKTSQFDPDCVMADDRLFNDYEPTSEALTIIRERIAEKIAMKPDWYKKTC